MANATAVYMYGNAFANVVHPQLNEARLQFNAQAPGCNRMSASLLLYQPDTSRKGSLEKTTAGTAAIYQESLLYFITRAAALVREPVR